MNRVTSAENVPRITEIAFSSYSVVGKMHKFQWRLCVEIEKCV